MKICELGGCDMYVRLNQNYIIQKVSGMEGAYDLKDVQIPFLTTRVERKNGNPFSI